jgi:hypothetical protein
MVQDVDYTGTSCLGGIVAAVGHTCVGSVAGSLQLEDYIVADACKASIRSEAEHEAFTGVVYGAQARVP